MLLFTCNYETSVRRSFIFLWMLWMCLTYKCLQHRHYQDVFIMIDVDKWTYLVAQECKRTRTLKNENEFKTSVIFKIIHKATVLCESS